jgi:uncharacterized cupredoxin-like copper-binding protein
VNKFLGMGMQRFALIGALLAGLSASCAPAASNAVTIRFHYSHFEPTLTSVPKGVPVTITLRNDDPIEHEWIIGPADVHELHRHGTESVHAHRPTEVTVPALSSRVTTITFDEAGSLAYICHLPGHEEYGMTGALLVR